MLSKVAANDVTYSAAKKACARTQVENGWREACELFRPMRWQKIKSHLGRLEVLIIPIILHDSMNLLKADGITEPY